MNKNNWTYKKLGEVCAHKNKILRANKYYAPNEQINYIDISSIDNSQNVIISTTPYIFSDAPSRAQQIVKEGDILISLVRPNLKNIAIVSSNNKQLVASSGFCVLRSEADTNNRYVFYIVRGESFTKHLLGRVQGANYPAVREEDIKNYIVPIPPLADQERIVAELDLLSSIIEKKKAQLKELDQLAQSIFYTMFGDPITNEKGWEVRKLGEVGELQRGSGLSKKDLIENGYPCILYGQIHTKYGAFTKKHIACIPQELVKTAKIAHFGDVIMAITSEDVEGSCKSVAWMGDYDIAVGSDAAIYRHTMNGIYVSYYTQTKAFYFEKAKYAKGFKVTHISTKEIANIPIPLPPLPLQQEFASKVEAIERQKSLIQQSIDETQTLFDSRMDYWFG